MICSSHSIKYSITHIVDAENKALDYIKSLRAIIKSHIKDKSDAAMKNKILQCKKIKLYTRHIENLKKLKQKITDKLQQKPNWELFVIFV
jgi:hypothetical protein